MKKDPFASSRESFVLLAYRLPFLLLCIATGIYCFIAYVPVLYEQMIRNELFPWVPFAVGLHPFLFLLAFAPVAYSFWKEDSKLSAGPIALVGLYGIGLIVFPLLPGLQSRFESLLWCLFWFLVPLSVGVFDLVLVHRQGTWRRFAAGGSESKVFQTAAVAGLIAAWTAFAEGSLRGGAPTFTLFAWSTFQHLFVFSLGAAWLAFALKAGEKLKRGIEGEVYAVAAVTIVALSIGIRQEVLVAFSFFSPWGFLISFLGSTAIVVYLTGLGTRIAELAPSSQENGLSVFSGWITAPFPSTQALLGGGAALVLLTSQVMPAAIHLVDWNFLMQRLFAVVSWGVLFAFTYRFRGYLRIPPKLAAVPPLLSLVALAWNTPPPGASRYLGWDASLQVASAVTRPTPPDLPFYSALRLRTNVRPEFPVESTEVKLVDKLDVTADRKPDIFLFVVDSLRRDYVGAYNPKAAFTPNLDKLAAESAVFRNAFARYGGTALSEASVWVGGLLPYRFYPSPFMPLNNLEKLLKNDGYAGFLSLDSILSQLMGPWQRLIPMDSGVPTQKLDICRTVASIAGHLENEPTPPNFFYTQPQNLHISLPKAAVQPEPKYAGFDGPYAGAVEYVDHCLGKLMMYLQQKKRLDDSLIIVTSDHGDSLGEEGRYGHSYNLFPEVLNIPLIVHLPAALRSKVKWDEQEFTFLTDIAPSLFYLLGHRPILNTPLTGRPLFTYSLDEQKPYLKDHYLLGASYGSVFGVLSGNPQSQSLYIADAVNRRDYSFENGMERDPSPEERAKNRKWIDEDLTALARFFPSKGSVRLPE